MLNISKTKQAAGLVSVEDVWEIDYVKSNGHATDNVTYDIIVVT